MKVVKGEHPREPGVEITVKPYYPWSVTRSRLNPGDMYPERFAKYEDASIRFRDGGGMIKGKQASLVVPLDEDPETGDYFDVDGTRSRDFYEMHVVEFHMFEYGFTVEGFVSLGDFFTNDPEAYKFAFERWDQRLRKDVEEEEAVEAEEGKD